MTIIYKALAALLDYPSAELLASLPEIGAIVDRERKFDRPTREALRRLVEELAASDLIDAQERYVALFDRGRATSLHLFEHVHGESRDRGQAMVDLNAVYAQAGLTLSANELPDFLPAMLEFLSLQPQSVADSMIDDCAHIVRKIGEELVRRTSRYAAVCQAVLALSRLEGLATTLAAGEPERSLDEEWLEEPVIFGPAAASSCGTKTAEPSVIRFMPREGAARKEPRP
jgi:nitrate reductase molybdenum cofactor assembly chaperone NarJ/NarW